MTSETIQRYARILVYYIAGALTSFGVVNVSASSKETIAGIVMFLANLAWTMWGTRLNALLGEVAKAGEVDKVIVNDPKIAAAVPDAKVTT